MSSAEKSTPSGLKVATTLLKLVGIGLGAGIALIAGTDKVMNKAFPQDEEELFEEKPENL